MRATLYAIPGSHAVRTGALMLEAKGVDYERVDWRPGLHRVKVRLNGFKGDRVPAVIFENGRRAQGTRQLPRVLDELVPEPRLVPDDPRVLEAERWADDVLQQWARRMVSSTGVHDPDGLTGRGGEGRLGPLLTDSEQQRRWMARMVMLAFAVTPGKQREDRAHTGEILDRVDGWIVEGVLGGERLYCADYAVVSSLALVDYIVALRPELARRPLYGLLERVLPA